MVIHFLRVFANFLRVPLFDIIGIHDVKGIGENAKGESQGTQKDAYLRNIFVKTHEP